MGKRLTTLSKIDIQSLAIIGVYLNDNGARPENQSDLVNKAIVVLADTLVKQGLSKPIVGVEESLEALANIGITYNRGSKAHKELEGLLVGKPNLERVATDFRTDKGGLDMDKLAREADEIRKRLEDRADPDDTASIRPKGD